MRCLIACAVSMLLGACAAPSTTSKSALDPNILLTTNGAVLCNFTSHWSEPYGTFSTPLKMLDGLSDTSWSSADNHPLQNVFELELPALYHLSAVGVDSSGIRNAFNLAPHCSPKSVQVWCSTLSLEDGYKMVAEFTMDEVTEKRVAINADARWIRFVILDNWGNPTTTEICELEAFGQPVSAEHSIANNLKFAGTYSTEWVPVKFSEREGAVTGCVDRSANSLLCYKNGPVYLGDWTLAGSKYEELAPVMVTATADRKFINVIGLVSFIGKREDAVSCRCSLPKSEKQIIADDLIHNKGLIHYGIQFAAGAATLTPASAEAIRVVAEVLREHPQWVLRVVAHTGWTDGNSVNDPKVDPDPTAHANKVLSKSRADTVVDALVKNGVGASRLRASGAGKSKPFMSKLKPYTMPQSFNRRIELFVEPGDSASGT